MLDPRKMKEKELTEEEKMDEFINEKDIIVTLNGLSTLSKEVKQSVVYLTDSFIRMLIDNYYQTQTHRIAIQGHVRAVQQGYDEVPDGEQPAIAWLLADVKNRENQIAKMIAAYVKSVPICLWATKIKGIGPMFAANLWSYIDMSKCKHANQWLSYCGQNDNNVPWLGIAKADALVKHAFEVAGLKSSDKLTDQVYIEVSKGSGRTISALVKSFDNYRKINKSDSDRVALTNYLAKPPYNIDLKKICYLIGESFVKVSNRGSLYGQLYRERKILETEKNERGEYADQAAKILRDKNFSKDTATKKLLLEGKLSPAHINSRAKRYAVKVFLTHFFEACYVYTYNEKPPVIYPIAHMDHVDYIEPEVPYDELYNCNVSDK